MSDTILYSQIDHVARLTLNNPSRHNSLGGEELRAIQEQLRRLASNDEVRVLVLTGAGEKTFCAGAALDQLGSGEISGDMFQQTTNQIAALDIPTICALNGNVFGGGVELALSCDFRLGIEGTRMRVPAAAIGLCYPISGIERFVERLGLNVAKRLLVAAETFDSEAMLETGFLDHLLLPSQLMQKTNELAEQIAALAPLSVAAMKGILQEAAKGEIDREVATALYERCANSEDLKEGFAAQKAKRTPVFTGR
ncbi:MAG: enoyl-CoA hydratase-related protein [Pseudomonadota bacterium]